MAVSESGEGSGPAGPVVSSGGGDSVSKHLDQRQWRVRELIDSENDYVADLGQCCQYIHFMKSSKDEESPEIAMPEDLKQGKDRMIFGNLEMIYEWHRE